MAQTEISGKRIKDGSVQRKDLDSDTPGQAVVKKVVAGTGISISSTGADAGTGDVTISASATSVPAGSIVAYGGAAAPSGWLLCNGAAVSRSTYASLFAALSTTYGIGDGSTTFNLPNLQQRFPLGKAASGTGATLGAAGGAIDHSHTSAAHSHTIQSHSHTINSHAHTIQGHSHPLSAAGAAMIGATSTNTYINRTSTGSWTAEFVANPAQGWSTNTTSVSTGASLTGDTDSSGVLTSDGSGTLTSNGSGTLTSDSTTPSNTGSNNPPYLVVNYIIKT